MERAVWEHASQWLNTPICGSIWDPVPWLTSSVWLKLLQKFSIRSIDQIKINAYILGPGNSTCAGQVIILCAHFLMCKIEIILPPGVIVKVKLDDTHKALSTQGLAQGKCSGNVYNIITAARRLALGARAAPPPCARCFALLPLFIPHLTLWLPPAASEEPEAQERDVGSP